MEVDPIGDDRGHIQPGDRLVLIVEDDVPFARILFDLAHDCGYKAIVTVEGGAAVALARQYQPSAITLDINLPDSDGWTVLDRLKHDPDTNHIPVHVISVADGRHRALTQGALG